MKISVSLPNEDVEFLDTYAANHGAESRSAAVHRAVRLLRASQLGPSYEAAWEEWASSDDSQLWDAASRDGLG